MDIELGVVCGQCDAYSPMGTSSCPSCGHDLALFKPQAAKPLAPAEKVAAALAPKRGGTLAPAARDRDREAAPPPPPPPPAPPIAPRKPTISPAEPSPRSRSQPRESLPTAGERRTYDLGPPLSQRAAATRPAAPDVLRPVSQPIAPKVEVIRRESQPHLPRVPPPGRAEPGTRGESWGHETTGKIPRAPVAGAARGKSKEELMDQAKNYVCRSCSTPIPSGHKFCGRCGAAVPPDILTLREEFYGSLQVPGRAKLIMIRSEGDPSMEGLSFALNAAEHIVGRQGHLNFPDDRFVSPRHANLFYREGVLVVRDEGSLNGVYLRVRGAVDAQVGDMFIAGEQTFRIDATPKASDHPEQDGTYFWSSPKRPSPFRVSQMLVGGAPGNVVCAREAGITIGREGGEMNYPSDVYMSATHARVDADPSGAKFTLTDLNSRNGTYLRIRGERELAHGDYVFLGKKILRVEITS